MDRPGLVNNADVTDQVIGLAMRVQTRLGPGLLKNANELCLCHELNRNGVAFRRQVEVSIEYDDISIDCGYRADVSPTRSFSRSNQSSGCCRCTRHNCSRSFGSVVTASGS
jgi:hypothetical protein